MNLILEGLLLGLTLMILLGPIFVALTQSAIEGGARAGIAVASGVWVSDFLIIMLCYFFVQRIGSLVEDNSFTYWMGLLGGFVLITFGIGTFLMKSSYDPAAPRQRLSTGSVLRLWTKGFLVNTVNPFTFVFWIGVTSNYVLVKKISDQEALLFFGTIMAVIMITDTAKVFGAKVLRNQLQRHHIDRFSKVAGVALFMFGIVLLWRVGVL